jgi:hypothetical protein
MTDDKEALGALRSIGPAKLGRLVLTICAEVMVDVVAGHL